MKHSSCDSPFIQKKWMAISPVAKGICYDKPGSNLAPIWMSTFMSEVLRKIG